MAQPSNKARVGEAFDLLATGLLQFVDVRIKKTVKEGQDWAAEFVRTSKNPDREYSLDDPSFLFNVMIDCWNGIFSRQLPRTTRNLRRT